MMMMRWDPTKSSSWRRIVCSVAAAVIVLVTTTQVVMLTSTLWMDPHLHYHRRFTVTDDATNIEIVLLSFPDMEETAGLELASTAQQQLATETNVTNTTLAVVTKRNQSGSTDAHTEQPTYHPNISHVDAPDSPSHTLPLCNMAEIAQHGRWQLTWSNAGPPYVSKTKHLRCYPPHWYRQRPFPIWTWQPHTCHVAPWHADTFCHVTQQHATTIAIIGDSLSWEQYSSLLQLLGQRVHQIDQHRSKTYRRNHVQFACQNRTRIVFRNDARLENITHAVLEQDYFPNILVLNRGAHYVPNDELLRGLQLVADELRSWRRSCAMRRRPATCRVLWRTTVPGHPNCYAVHHSMPSKQVAVDMVPSHNRSAMEARIGNLSNYDNVTVSYHWYDFAHQNKLVQQFWSSNQDVNVEVLDAYAVNVLRPDEHRAHQRDCLHNCYPGKMDVYNQMLLHFLIVHDEEGTI